VSEKCDPSAPIGHLAQGGLQRVDRERNGRAVARRVAHPDTVSNREPGGGVRQRPSVRGAEELLPDLDEDVDAGVVPQVAQRAQSRYSSVAPRPDAVALSSSA
jgi:hypothetical protein